MSLDGGSSSSNITAFNNQSKNSRFYWNWYNLLWRGWFMEVIYLMFCNIKAQKGNADMQTSLQIHKEVLFLVTALSILFAQ